MALVTNYPNSHHLFFIPVIEGCLLQIMTPSSGYSPLAVPPFSQEMLSPNPTPPSPPRGCGPDPWSPNPSRACGGTERSRVSASRAAGQGTLRPGCLQGGAALAAAPSPRLPHPQRRHPSFRPARSPPSPRRRLPAALPRWPRASQAASERGERSGMGLGGSGEGGDSGRGSGSFRGSHERPLRTAAPPRAARGPTTKTRVAAPVSLPRRRRRQRLQVSGTRFPRGSTRPRRPEEQTHRRPGRPTDRQSRRARADGRTRLPPPGLRARLAPAPAAPRGPSGQAPPPARSPSPRPRRAGASGGRRCPDPRGGEKSGRLGRASGTRSPRGAHGAAAGPQCPVGALSAAAGTPDLGSSDPGRGRLVERASV